MRRIKPIQHYFVTEDENGGTMQVTQEKIESTKKALRDKIEFYQQSKELKDTSTSDCIRISDQDQSIIVQAYWIISGKIKAEMKTIGAVHQQVIKRVPNSIKRNINKEIKTINKNIDGINLCHYECAKFFIKSENYISKEYCNMLVIGVTCIIQAGIANLTMWKYLEELKKYLTKPELEIITEKLKTQEKIENDLIEIQEGITTLINLL